MAARAGVLGALLFSLMLGGAADTASSPGPRENEEKLLARLERENNPVKKAKLEILLGRMKLSQVFEEYNKGNFEQAWKNLDAYSSRMKEAWKILEDSGRIASKKPDGFKQLDIALRESRRALEDFETRVTFEERQVVEKTRKQTEELRKRVLDALFPPLPPGRRKNSQTRFAGRTDPSLRPKGARV